jgi:hypothetical protein
MDARQAQRRKFAQLLVEGKISNQTFEEWNRETGRKKLPERVARISLIGVPSCSQTRCPHHGIPRNAWWHRHCETAAGGSLGRE